MKIKNKISLSIISLLKLLIIILLIESSNSKNNKEKDLSKDESKHKTITKYQFIEYYNKFFVEMNPIPEIADLYKENPNFFRLLLSKLVESLPEKFPLHYVQKLFAKEKIIQAVVEMKDGNITNEQYYAEKKMKMEEPIKLQEEEALKKKKEKEENESKKANEHSRLIYRGNFGNIFISIKIFYLFFSSKSKLNKNHFFDVSNIIFNKSLNNRKFQ